MQTLSDILRAAADRLEVNGGNIGEVVEVLKTQKVPEVLRRVDDDEQRIVNDIVIKAMYGY